MRSKCIQNVIVSMNFVGFLVRPHKMHIKDYLNFFPYCYMRNLHSFCQTCYSHAHFFLLFQFPFSPKNFEQKHFAKVRRLYLVELRVETLTQSKKENLSLFVSPTSLQINKVTHSTWMAKSCEKLANKLFPFLFIQLPSPLPFLFAVV